MSPPLVLASGSEIRARLLRNAGVEIDTHPVRIDEPALRDALVADGTGPRDVADALAEMKAAKAAGKLPGTLVLGCDQVLDLDGAILSKPSSRDAARADLTTLRGRTHRLHSAVVAYEDGRPVWRHVGTARLTMHDHDDAWIDAYLGRNWPAIASSVGGYRLEEEGIRLFSRIDGDYFTILGLPLVELLSYLERRGTLDP